jgi:hypothetical protein
MNKLITLGALPAILIILVWLAPADGQLEQSDCNQGAVWHYKQASHWDNADSQDFHIAAAESLSAIKENGGSCPDWQEDAQPPRYDPATNRTTQQVQ